MGEVCVRFYAAGVNPSDAYTLTGTYAFSYTTVTVYPRLRRSRDCGASVGTGRMSQTFVLVIVYLLRQKRDSKSTGTFAEKIVCDANWFICYQIHVSFEQGAGFREYQH